MDPITLFTDQQGWHPVTLAEDQPQYRKLPVLVGVWEPGSPPERPVVSRWKLTWRERWQVLWRGELWHTQMVFYRSVGGRPVPNLPPPILLHTSRPDYIDRACWR